MNYQEFLSEWKIGKLELHVDKSLAMRAADAGMLPPGNRAAFHFWSWIWLVGLIAALPCFIWTSWWIGAIVLIVSLMLRAAIKQTAAQGVSDRILQDEKFYNFAHNAGLIRLTRKSN